MDVTFVLTTLALTLLAYIIFKVTRDNGKSHGGRLPPGPYGIPILGYIPFLGRNTHLTFTELGKRYGSVFSLKMGKYIVVVLHDWKAIKSALVDQGDVFAGRPKLEFAKEVGDKNQGIIATDGEVWKVHRRFTLSRLRDFGFGKRSLDSVIEKEVDDLCRHFERVGEDGLDMKSELFIPLLNVIWRLVGGKQFDRDDPSMSKIKDIVTQLIALNGVHFYTFIPKFLMKLGFGAQREKKREMFFKMKDIIKKEIDYHRETISKDDPRDLIDMYLIEMEKQQKESQNIEDAIFSDNSLISTAENLFLAGVETSANTLAWGIHYLVVWTEVQDKIQDELDKVVGRDRAPTLQDRTKLPYTNAAIMEVQRLGSIAPLAIAHRNMKATTLLGYHIPKDTTVIPNLWSLTRDPALWGDPENFRPERFLNKDGNVEKPEYFLPFSLGPRVCLGESLAKTELFLFFSNLLHQFRFQCPAGAPPPNLDAAFALTLSPPAYNVIAKKRL